MSDLAKRINERERVIIDRRDRIIDEVGRIAREVEEQGFDLIEAKKACSHGHWLEWLAENCPGISEVTARRYMRVAERSREIDFSQCKSIREIYVAAGIFPENTTDPTTKKCGGRIQTWQTPVQRLAQMLNPDNLKNFEPDVIETLEKQLSELLARVLEFKAKKTIEATYG